MAVAEASFKISIDRMSEGFIVDNGEIVEIGLLPNASPRPKSAPLLPPPCTITPSIT